MKEKKTVFRKIVDCLQLPLIFGGLLYVIRIACFQLIFSVSPARYFAFYEKKACNLERLSPQFYWLGTHMVLFKGLSKVLHYES